MWYFFDNDHIVSMQFSIASIYDVSMVLKSIDKKSLNYFSYKVRKYFNTCNSYRPFILRDPHTSFPIAKYVIIGIIEFHDVNNIIHN